MKTKKRNSGRDGGRKPSVAPGQRVVQVGVQLPEWAELRLAEIGPSKSAAARDLILAGLGEPSR
jgi:hypothetical protein